MGLFKYCGESGLSILKKLELKVTPPNEFNDPFEFNPVICKRNPQEYAKREVKKFIQNRHFFETNKVHFPQCKNFREFQVVARANIGVLTSALTSKSLNVDSKTDVLDMLSESFGLICFSADPLQPLMWAHYAASHKGLVIEFDSGDPLFKHESFLKVDYDPARAEYDITAKDTRAAVEAFAKRKSPDWAYEQEYRLILNLNLAQRKDIRGQYMYLVPIEPSLLKSVTIGLRATDATHEEVMSLAGSPPLEHLVIYQIETDATQFKLHQRKIK